MVNESTRTLWAGDSPSRGYPSPKASPMVYVPPGMEMSSWVGFKEPVDGGSVGASCRVPPGFRDGAQQLLPWAVLESVKDRVITFLSSGPVAVSGLPDGLLLLQ